MLIVWHLSTSLIRVIVKNFLSSHCKACHPLSAATLLVYRVQICRQMDTCQEHHTRSNEERVDELWVSQTALTHKESLRRDEDVYASSDPDPNSYMGVDNNCLSKYRSTRPISKMPLAFFASTGSRKSH